MRRADVVWHYNPASNQYLNLTDVQGSGTSSTTLVTTEKLYVGMSDWLSGLYISSSANATPSIIIETFDANSNTWKTLPLQERLDQISTGHQMSSTGYSFMIPGVAMWGTSPYGWTPKNATRTFPENLVPPEEVTELYWVRLRNVGPETITVSRILPIMYNTYSTVDTLSEFMGMPNPFDELRFPTRTYLRHQIRQAEDWLDDYTRKAWRLRYQINERTTWNPHGIKLAHTPVWFVDRLSLWSADHLQEMHEGRNNDFFVSSETGMLYFTRVVFGRGLNWMQTSPRYMRQNDSVEIDYVWGEDFELSARRDMVRDIVNKRVGAALVRQSDWTAVLVNNPDTVPKPEKAKTWSEEALSQADQIRGLLIR